MGLDQFAYLSKKGLKSAGFELFEDGVEIGYWRKSYWLQTMMHQMTNLNDNNRYCTEVTAYDIDRMEKECFDYMNREGYLDGIEDNFERDEFFKFIGKARQGLKMGYRVFYLEDF